ncbi:MAG: hypothetical protein EA381_09625 [Planctomycetaceae bacterium]|nr:MAG: hypothetical protein EA381_09625 [Planctomycetaceae bacterium]
MNVTREDLVGYLLAALEPHEMRCVEERLSVDPLLRDQLAELQRTLQVVDERMLGPDRVAELPSGLGDRTLALIDSAMVSPSGCGWPAGVMAKATPIRSVEEIAWRGRRRKLADWLVGGLAGVALLGIGFPTVAHLREESRSVICQDNLRCLGDGLMQFVLRDPQERLPALDKSGPRAFSGMWAVHLFDVGALTDSDSPRRWCPSGRSPRPDDPPKVPAPNGRFQTESPVPGLTRLVRKDEIRRASETKNLAVLSGMQRNSGGNYSYNLGVRNGGEYLSPHYEARPNFAVLGDSPTAGDYQGTSVDVTRMSFPHPRNGANVWYEDGSVRTVYPARMSGQVDHPYMNHRGAIEAGVNLDDASLAPSGWPPFLDASQR